MYLSSTVTHFWFSGDFRGYKMGTLARIGLMQPKRQKLNGLI